MDIEALIARGLQILLALGGAYLIATWFVLAVWTFRDIESRSKSVVTQVFSTLLVVLFWVPGLLLYWLLRPKETLDEAYQRSLEEEYLLQDLEEMPLCPTCNHLVQDEWQICPHCATHLREPCSNCGQLIDLKWEICPYCGSEHTHDHHDDEATQLPGERWVDPVAIEQRLRAAEERRLLEESRALPAVTALSAEDRDRLMQSLRRLEEATAANAASRNGHGSPNGTNGATPASSTAASTVAAPAPTATSAASPEATSPLPNLDEIAAPDRPVSDADADETSIPERFRVK